MSRGSVGRILFPFALILLLGIDAATKQAALVSIPYLMPGSYPFGGIPLLDFSQITFSLNTVTNTGVAWGLLQGYPGVLFSVRIIAILMLIGYALSLRKNGQKNLWPFWLVVVGAIGNAIDYICYGRVIDFFHWTFWGYSFPLFNCADAYITIGVFFLIFSPALEKWKIGAKKGLRS